MKWVCPGATPQPAAPAIIGTEQVGQTLEVDTQGISDADGLTEVSYSYQWLADDAEIDGATGSTYKVRAEDEGKAIKVRVDFTDDKGNPESLTSEPTEPVSGWRSLDGLSHCRKNVPRCRAGGSPSPRLRAARRLRGR